MDIFAVLLFNKFNCCVSNHQAYFYVPILARWRWLLHKLIYKITCFWRRHWTYENFLYVPIRKTLCPSFFSYVHQTLRKLLRVRSSPCTLYLLNHIFLLNKWVAYWDFSSLLAWYKWLLLDFGQSLQSKFVINLGL